MDTGGAIIKGMVSLASLRMRRPLAAHTPAAKAAARKASHTTGWSHHLPDKSQKKSSEFVPHKRLKPLFRGENTKRGGKQILQTILIYIGDFWLLRPPNDAMLRRVAQWLEEEGNPGPKIRREIQQKRRGRPDIKDRVTSALYACYVSMESGKGDQEE